VQLVSLAKVEALVQIIRMRFLPKTCLVAAPLLVLLALGCQGSVDGGPPPGSGGSGGAGGGLNLAGGVELPSGTEAAALLPARIRRLSDAEYQASVSALLQDGANGVSAGFVPDSRQSGFTVNAAQRVDPVFARQLAEAAITLAANVRARLAELAPCPNPTTDADACADKFIRDFGGRAYRRPLGDDEVTHLMTVFHTAYQGGTYDEGVELVARAMLQSAAFLYLTEIGDAPAATIKLTAYELASSISYLAQGGPPSQSLLDNANQGLLDTDTGRASVLNKLNLFGPSAQERVARVVREWLGTDRILETAKDSNVYAGFDALKSDLDLETTSFLNSVVSGAENNGGSLANLLAGNWTVGNSRLATLYGSTAPGSDEDNQLVRIELPNRLGILNHGAFLSVFAHAHETAPVLRGVAVMRRVACVGVADPVDLKTAVVPPAPDPAKTTRERFAAHATPECATCHDRIDSFGFAFEGFDGMGRSRTIDNGEPVDAKVVIAGTDFDGSYADSNALAKAMSTSPQVRQCFARHVFRALAASSDPELAQSEDDFLKYWDTTLERTPEGTVSEVRIIGTLAAFITSRSFAYRRAQ
jgi:hypothetical protein